MCEGLFDEPAPNPGRRGADQCRCRRIHASLVSNVRSSTATGYGEKLNASRMLGTYCHIPTSVADDGRPRSTDRLRSAAQDYRARDPVSDYGAGGPLSSPLSCITATMPPKTAMPATTHNASWSAHIVLWLPGAELHPAVAKDAATTRTARGSGWIRTPEPPRTHRSDIIEFNCGV